MAHYKGAASEAGRAMHLMKKRERAAQEVELRKKKIEEELKINNIESKFATHYDAVEAQLKSSTIGLVTLDEMKAKQEHIVREREQKLAQKRAEKEKERQKEIEAKQAQKNKQKRQIQALSFTLEEEEEEADEEDTGEVKKEDTDEVKREDTGEMKREDTGEVKREDTGEVNKKEDTGEVKKEDTVEVKKEDSGEVKREDTVEVKKEDAGEVKKEDTGEVKKEVKETKPTSWRDKEEPVYKKVRKNPDVDTSFLPDRDREEAELKLREELRLEWVMTQASLKDEPINITFSYWDGSGHRRSVVLKKGNSIYQFLQRCLEALRQEFSELKTVTADQLMYVKEDLILPHHYTFYDFIVTKARGKSGPLFTFDVSDDVRLVNDATQEKQDSHAGKVLIRSWYERNKHIFPASRWEPYDPTKTYSKYTIKGK